MKTFTTPFGEKVLGEVKKGDLVWWNNWQVVDDKLTKITNFGVFLRKESQFYGLREVLFGILIDSKSGNEIKVLAIRLKKANTN